MEKPFLLITSTVFDGADLIDCIRQSCIDLNEESDGELVGDLIKDSIEKLSGDCSYEVAIEIVALLSKCFSVLSIDPMPFLNTLFEKSKNNAYLMYSFISNLSYLINSKLKLDFEPYVSFINDLLAEIKSQNNYKDSLTISGLEIPLHFRANLIVELLLCTKPTEQLIKDFPYVFQSDFFNECPKLKPLVNKIADSGFGRQLLFLVLLNDDNNNNTDDAISTEIPVTPDFEDPLFNEFLKDPCVENNEAIKKKLFMKILTDKSNLLGYFQIIFENLSKLRLEPVNLLEYFYEEFQMSQDDFVKTFDNVYILHPSEKVFVPQPKYKPLNLPDSEFNNQIITKLFDIVHKDPGHFQAFYCLECIANSFPFIFASNPQKVFDAVLPAFENYKIIYNEETSEDYNQEIAKIRNGKAAIAAISFLLFTLNSTKVCDAFVQWFFQNINNLSLSQLLCMFIVFLMIFTTKCMDHLTTLFIKNNFFEAISNVLLKKVPNSLFGYNFNYFMYTLFQFNKTLHNVLSPIGTLAIDINKNEDNLFFKGSGCRITHGIDRIQPPEPGFYIHADSNRLHIKKEFIYFMNTNKNFLPTWTIESRSKKSLPNRVDELFIDIYKRLIPQQQEAAPDFELPTVSDKITNDQIRIFVNKENWVREYIMLRNKFPLLAEHKRIVDEIMTDICKVDDSITDDDERLFKNFSMKKYFESYHESQSFLRNLISRTITSNIQPLIQMSNYVGMITFHEDHYDVVMDAICKNLTFIDQNISFTEKSSFFGIQINVLFLATFAKERMESRSVKNSQFTKLFFEKAGNKVINFILKPQYRSNESILMIAYELLSIFNEYPIHVLHIIAFMFCSHDRILRKRASRLCLGLKEEQLKQLSSLDNVFQDELLSLRPQYTIISNFLKSYKSIGLAHKGSLLTILKELLHMCQRIKDGLNIALDDGRGKDDITVKDFIIQLLDYLSPDRDENRSFTLTDSSIASEVVLKKNKPYRFCPIPDYIIATAPEFWKVFEEYRPLINEILLKEFKGNKTIEVTGVLGILLKYLYVDNFSSRLVSNYPECFSFEFRSTFFRQTQHEEIKFFNEIEVEIDLDNLFESSFRQLHTKSPKEWKNKFLIKYLGSDGLDQSGITKDWFTKMTLEIFNPQSNLFEMSENNQNYSPSRSNFAQSEEGLEKLRFTGMIIARALMQGFLVPVQFTKPFLKQILHHGDKIKPEDLEDVSEELYNQLQKIKQYDFDKVDLDLRFEVDFEGKTTELIEKGSEIKVDNKNKEEYIRLRSLHRMKDAITKQVSAFCDGFDSILPHEKVRMFTPTELCLLICGVPNIDVDDLRRNVEIKKPYDINSPVIKLFFNTIKKWDDENLAKLLIFITGTSRVPSNGFVYFKQINSPITIQVYKDQERLPVAHTCINTLDLPEYQSEEEMNSKLLMAINVQDFPIK